MGLLAVALCCLVIGCGPHRTTDTDVKVVKSNLQQFHAAGMQFLLESGKLEARHGDIVGESKYIISIKPVNGEDYSGLVLKGDTTSLSVKAADGREIVWIMPR